MGKREQSYLVTGQKIKSLNYCINLYKPTMKNYYYVPALHKNLPCMKISICTKIMHDRMILVVF